MNASSTSTQGIDIQAFMDERPLGPLQWLVLLLGFLVVMTDGMDTVAIGLAAPSLTKEWGLASSALGPVMSAALVGIGVGALLAGPAADRFGRRGVIIASVLWFGVFSLASVLCTDVVQLSWVRLLTGLGLGACLPNTLTLVSEYSPSRLRGKLTTAAYCGFPIGMVLGSFSATWLVQSHGWKSVFIVGGVLPLILVPVLLVWLPESIKLMIARGRPERESQALLRRLAPGEDLSGRRLVEEARGPHGDTGTGVLQLLSSKYLPSTLLLWATYFMGLVVFYFLTIWLPMLLTSAGIGKNATLVTSLFPLGGVIGIFGAGWLVDRTKPVPATAIGYFATAVLALLVYGSFRQPVLLCVLVFLSGIAVSGALAAMIPITANYYPTLIRATGVSWMLSVGRLGGVAGAYVGATLNGFGWGYETMFGAMAIPALLAGLGMLLLGWSMARSMRPSPAAPTPGTGNR